MPERSNRLDWRLLLPSSLAQPVETVLVLGGTDAMCQSLVDHGLANEWRRPSGPADHSQFVVAWDDCTEDAEEVARRVAPNGAVYMEVDRRRRGRRRLGLARVRAALARGGCHLYSAHVVTPDLERPRRYLPMDDAHAMRWHLRVLFVAGTPIARAVRACLDFVLATPVGDEVVRLVGVRYMVVATAAPDDSAPLGVPVAHGDERAMLVTSGYDQGSRAVVLPFGRHDRDPLYVVKVASTAATAVGTIREHERLTALHATLPTAIAAALPKPIGVYTLAELTACTQTCAAGPSMSTSVGRWHRSFASKCRDLDVVVDWLADFAMATRVDIETADRNWTSVFEQAKATIEPSDAVASLLTHAQHAGESSSIGRMAVHQHYDAGPWNVHIDGLRPMLIDWETDDFRPADSLGPPLADMLYLVTYWYFLMCNADSPSAEEAAIARLFTTSPDADEAVLVARTAIDRTLARLGLDRSAVRPALVALWAERAVYTRLRRAALGVGMESGGSKPEAYLRVLAAMEADDW